MPKYKWSSGLKVFQPRLSSLRSTRASFFRNYGSVQILTFKYIEIPYEEEVIIQEKLECFLAENRFPDDKIESILNGDIGTGVLLLRSNQSDEFDLKVNMQFDEETRRTLFTMVGTGIAKICCKEEFQIADQGFEFCTGFYLYNPSKRLCLAGHLPIDEANVVHVIDNILYPIFESLKKEGVNLRQSKLLLCCGDDIQNPSRLENEVAILPGELAYLRIKSTCSEMFKEIIFDKNHIVRGNTKVIFDSNKQCLITKKNSNEMTYQKTGKRFKCQ